MGIVAPRILFTEFMHKVRPDSPLRECRKSLKFIKNLKGARLTEGVEIEQRN